MLSDIAWGWHLDTQAIEGTNNRIKMVLKKAPHLCWKKLPDHLVSSAMCRGLSKDQQEQLCTICEAFHRIAQTSELSATERMYFLTKPTDAAAAPRPPPPPTPPPTHTVNEVCAARLLRALRKDEVWGVQRSHGTACQTALGFRDNNAAPNAGATLWIPAHWFREETWCAKATIDIAASEVHLCKPLDAVSLLVALRSALDASESLSTADHKRASISIALIQLTWDMNCLHSAHALVRMEHMTHSNDFFSDQTKEETETARTRCGTQRRRTTRR